MRYAALLVPMLFLVPLAQAEVLFAEDWESGAIDPAVWRTTCGEGALLAVEDIAGDGSDHALALWAGPKQPHWTINVNTVRRFARSDAPVLHAKLWGDPTRGDDTYRYPAGMGWLLGFHNGRDILYGRAYEGQEAVLDNWFAPMYGDMNRWFQFTQAPVKSVFQQGHGGRRLSLAFMEAIQAAMSKQAAIEVRIQLGPERGAKFEWFNPITRAWVVEADTLGITGGETEEVTVGFGPAGACVFIDDIVVSRGPVGAPPPATPTPPGVALFEDWETGVVDREKWDLRVDSGNCLASVLDVSGDGSDHALALWIGPKPLHWPIAVKSKLGFKRSSAPEMTALIWGDPTRTDGTYTYPKGMGWLLGFHNEPGAKPWIWDHLEAVLDDWLAPNYGNTRLRFTQAPDRSLFARGNGGPQLPDRFTEALERATSKARAVRIRIRLGEQQGASFAWQAPGSDTWVEEMDTRGVSGGTAEDVGIGFGPASACVFVDDIVVTGEASDMYDGIPHDYPRFRFECNDREAKLLTNFYWYHFVNRIVAGGYGRTLFNKEYISISDLWADGAKDGPENKPIQATFRESLLTIRQDPDGYIHTHQHFSHAHEAGWPFPLWTQVPEGPLGVTAGWHFQKQGPGWALADAHRLGLNDHLGEQATTGWKLRDVVSDGVKDGRWQLRATGPDPAVEPPLPQGIDAFNCPFLQLRWLRTPGEGAKAYVEWQREGDTGYSADRRVGFGYGEGGNPEYESQTGVRHSLVKMVGHPGWEGRITALRIGLAPSQPDATFAIDSFFTVYDTRHAMNNPLFILASWNYYRWTGDRDFLRENMPRLRKALAFQRGEMGGLEHNFIRNPWNGHDGRPGFTPGAPGEPKTFHNGHGIGDQYCDILPFGGDAFESTVQYYASTLAMAEMEILAAAHPEWNIPTGGAFDPDALRAHAAAVKQTANEKFWNPETGRFVASIDADGVPHDYGYTFMNQEAIWLGLATEDHARTIMDWISGRRTVAGDTAQGADIYHWRLAPRLSTKRNVDWYGFIWSMPETIPWGFQIQDGGAVLGFSFHDLWSRLKIYGPADAWQRLTEILDWEEEVWREDGYRNYYDNHEGTLQGGGPPGGLGIDQEFLETSMVPAIVPLGFMGLDPRADALHIRPNLPPQCPEMTVTNLLYHGARLNITASNEKVTIEVRTQPAAPLPVCMDGNWHADKGLTLAETGAYQFTRE